MSDLPSQRPATFLAGVLVCAREALRCGVPSSAIYSAVDEAVAQVADERGIRPPDRPDGEAGHR